MSPGPPGRNHSLRWAGTSGQEAFPAVFVSPLGAQVTELPSQKPQSPLLFSTFEDTNAFVESGDSEISLEGSN